MMMMKMATIMMILSRMVMPNAIRVGPTPIHSCRVVYRFVRRPSGCVLHMTQHHTNARHNTLCNLIFRASEWNENIASYTRTHFTLFDGLAIFAMLWSYLLRKRTSIRCGRWLVGWLVSHTLLNGHKLQSTQHTHTHTNPRTLILSLQCCHSVALCTNMYMYMYIFICVYVKFWML